MSSPSSAPSPVRVALVDDDEESLWVGKEVLSLAGFDVQAYAAPEDLERDLPDAVWSAFIVDWNLGGRTAANLIRSARMQCPRAPIVILTGESIATASSGLVEAREQLGCELLRKPTPWRQVAATVERLMDASG